MEIDFGICKHLSIYGGRNDEDYMYLKMPGFECFVALQAGS
jgi:hypothetical protein